MLSQVIIHFAVIQYRAVYPNSGFAVGLIFCKAVRSVIASILKYYGIAHFT